jgi:hypothetical protein
MPAIHDFVKQFGEPEPDWKTGRIETTSPKAEEKVLEVEYVIFAGGTMGRFRLKNQPEEPFPGKLFRMPGEEIFGWQKGKQKFHLENGTIVLIHGEFIGEDGFFKTDGEQME